MISVRHGVLMIAILSGGVFPLPRGATAQSSGGVWDFRVSADFELRTFPRSRQFSGQRGIHLSPSIVMEPEAVYESESGAYRFTARPFARLDPHDEHRSHFDVREFGLLHLGSDWTLFAGLGSVFWGVTESNHLVDIINQVDGVEDIDSEDKLGQPMVSVTLERDWGALDLYYLPAFRERTFPGDRARLRGPLPISDDVRYTSGAGRYHQDWAVRWSHVLGDVDLAVAFFRGTGRDPVLIPEQVGGQAVLVPEYSVVDQTSLELQWTRGATLWKLEALAQGGQGHRFGAFVAGLEHTLYQLGDGDTDLGLLAEVMVDDRDSDAPVTLFDNDIFAGMRWAWNDVADTSILGGPVIDFDTGEVLAFVEAERRVGDAWTVEVEGRWFGNTEVGTFSNALRRDGFVTLRVGWHY